MNKDRNRILAWCLYDFANSSYSAVIAAVVFPVYYARVVVGNDGGLGDLWWGRAISLSMLIVALSSPFLGGLADAARGRRLFLAGYTLVAVAAVAGLAAVGPGMVLTGFLLIVTANVGMEGGLVFYNAYLPDVAPEGRRGRVSAWGFGLGYAGSLLSLLLVLPLVDRGRFPLVWLLVAVFFLVFAAPLLLQGSAAPEAGAPLEAAARSGAKRTLDTLAGLWRRPRSRRFLLAFLLYQDGVNTVIVFSSLFAATTLGFGNRELVLLYMLVQVTALAGSFLAAPQIDRRGPARVIRLALLLWIVVAGTACFTETKGVFWGLASVAGLGLGTVQAASRAFFTTFIPRGEESGHFGVYALVGKSSAVLGPFVFGQVSHLSGSQRPALLAVALFFLAGLLLLPRDLPGDGALTGTSEKG